MMPLKHPLELERSQCPSPSSSLDIVTNPLVWETADRLVWSLLQEANETCEEEDEYDLLEVPLHLPKPIPVHPAHVSLLTPAATALICPTTTALPRPHSAMW